LDQARIANLVDPGSLYVCHCFAYFETGNSLLQHVNHFVSLPTAYRGNKREQ